MHNILWEKLRLAAGRLLQRLGLRYAPEVNYIGGSETLPPPLQKEEEERYILQLAQGEESAKKMLIEHNLRMWCISPAALKIRASIWRISYP